MMNFYPQLQQIYLSYFQDYKNIYITYENAYRYTPAVVV